MFEKTLKMRYSSEWNDINQNGVYFVLLLRKEKKRKLGKKKLSFHYAANETN